MPFILRVPLDPAGARTPTAWDETSSLPRRMWAVLMGPTLLPSGQAMVGGDWLSCHISQCWEEQGTGLTVGHGKQQEGNTTAQGLSLRFPLLTPNSHASPTSLPTSPSTYDFWKTPTDTNENDLLSLYLPSFMPWITIQSRVWLTRPALVYDTDIKCMYLYIMAYIYIYIFSRNCFSASAIEHGYSYKLEYKI